jgi:hypothetical protein
LTFREQFSTILSRWECNTNGVLCFPNVPIPDPEQIHKSFLAFAFDLTELEFDRIIGQKCPGTF